MSHVRPDLASMSDNHQMLVAMLIEDHRQNKEISDGFAGLQQVCGQQFSDARDVLSTNYPNLLNSYGLRMSRIERLFEGLAGAGRAGEREVRVRRAELIFDLQRLFFDLDQDLLG